MKLSETADKKILISPLNWGMGHVSRCIGLIRLLLAQNNEILIACDAPQQKIFESYFPDIQFTLHQGYPFDFSGKGNFANDLFQNRKKLLPRFVKEQQEVQKLVIQHDIDLVISDQRYGFFSTKVPSIFVTHQIHLSLKWYQFVAGWLNSKLIRNFTFVWCMDDAEHSLAGDLSRPVSQICIDYIGYFSRFEHRSANEENKFEKLFVISGPEPYAEQFFNETLDYCTNHKEKFACLVPHAYTLTKLAPKNMELVVATNWKENDHLFLESETIVSRAGYSTLMDLKTLNTKAILVPTPGQSEQIYLSELHQNYSSWRFCKSLQDLK